VFFFYILFFGKWYLYVLYMKTISDYEKSKQRFRVVNLPLEEYKIIKEYCKSQALNAPRWIVKIALEKINAGNPDNK
jgi:hypothetical protein